MSRTNFLQRDLYVLYTYILTRQKKPYLASYKLLFGCNLACRQCPFHNLPGDKPGYAQVLDTLQALYQRGNRIVIFEGGEPMLWQDGSRTIYDVVTAANRLFPCTGMTTNGTRPLDAPVDVLWVSLDGLRETHNRLRGADIFDRVMDNIRSSPHPRLYAHITANRENAGEIPELIRSLKGLVKGITVQFYYPYNRDDHLFLEFPRRAALLDELIHLKRQGYPILNSSAALKALQANTWRCVDWLIDNANPDGSLSQGCYLRGRADIDCARCGFSPYTEISLAYRGNLKAVLAGLKIFFA